MSEWLCGCREKERLHDAARLETLKLEAAAEQQRWEAYEVGHLSLLEAKACMPVRICITDL